MAVKIFSLKHQKLNTTEDYIHAYNEIDTVLPNLTAKVQSLAEAINQIEIRDRARGAINIQRFYKTSGPEYTKILKDMIEELRESVSLTREESTVIRKMAELPDQEQVAFGSRSLSPFSLGKTP